MGHAECTEDADLVYQRAILPDVSRTFALTIPQLPQGLELAVGNAYLLCRIADTIEDEPHIDDCVRLALHRELIEVLEHNDSAAGFAERASRALSSATSESERALVADFPKVVAINSKLPAARRAAIERCVHKMCKGMPEYQHIGKARGLDDMVALDRYCYYVAGVVGELLTELFCDHSPAIAQRHDELSGLAASFGQGLQMTNILKDVWEDQARGYCWLPRDIFSAAGYDLDRLASDHDRAGFHVGLTRLIAIAHGHLRNAFRYTLLIPAEETGIRRFCLWAIGMALLTLKKVQATPDYVSPSDVKVSRRAVGAVVLSTRLTARSDLALKALFHLTARGLPKAEMTRANAPLPAAEGTAGS